MFVELHIIQNFAPSNLNRDDTGSPKDCEFGGYRRARVSSQCLKRAIRDSFKDEKLIPEANLAVRTKLLINELANKISAKGKSLEDAMQVVESAISGIGLGLDKDKKTQYLMFIGQEEIKNLAEVCFQNWDLLSNIAVGDKKNDSAKDAKKAAKAAMPPEIQKALDGKKAADLALFGRMLADKPEKNVDAACQVAHAISTNRVSIEFDFFTAIDDLQPDDNSGAGMLGTVEFDSACFYRYANIDLSQLFENLGDLELAKSTLEAFLRASVNAVPTGKQNSMAAQNPPSFVMAVVREKGLWSMANAFVQPVKPDSEKDMVKKSIELLDDYWAKLKAMYGEKGIIEVCCCSMEGKTKNLEDQYKNNLDEIIATVLAKANFEGGGNAA